MPPPQDTHRADQLVELEPVLRRVVAARVGDAQAVDDLVQETLSQVVHAGGRLEDSAVAAYAVTVARNLGVSFVRRESRRRRNIHRLIDLRSPEQPEERALREEERAALATALTKLSAREREALIGHEVDELGTATLAEKLGTTPGAVAVLLARARAKLRVDYLLAFRRIELPTLRCRPVLVALSAGDRRRQRALDAGGHLLECQVCAALSEPVVERRRSLAVFLPLGLPDLTELLRWLRRYRVQVSTAGMTLAVAVAVVAVAAAAPDRPAPVAAQPPVTSAPASTLLADGRPLLPLGATVNLTRYDGADVRSTGTPVQSVQANEGFWVGSSERDRVWVQLATGGRESSVQVKAGQLATFTGRMVANPPGFARRIGVGGRDGALLDRQGHHIQVRPDQLRLA